ncbi:MAG: hypothetical protein K6C98_01055 [Treponema sp.]|nr:hypothetical protein [Treponema sp.]
MNDEWLVKEIKDKFHENDYPGSSLQCGVFSLFYNHGKSSAIYYPAQNCILLDDNYIIKHVYSHKQADKLMRKIHGHYSKGKKDYYNWR